MTIHNSNQKELHILAAGLLKEKVADEIIIGRLRSRGVDSYYAEIILDNVKTDVEDKKQFWKHIPWSDASGYCFHHQGIYIIPVNQVIFSISPAVSHVPQAGLFTVFPPLAWMPLRSLTGLPRFCS